MANRVEVQFGATTGELKSAIDEVNSSLDSIKSHVEGLTSGFQTLAGLAGVALSFDGLKAGFDSLAKFADEIQNAQARVGGSLESITTLSGVAALAGVSFNSLTEDVARANLEVQKSTSDAYGPAAQGLKALGLSAQSLTNLPVDQWFGKVSDAVSRFNPSITLTSNVQQAFGQRFAQLLPLLMQGSEHFQELQDSVRKAQEGLSATLPGISETEEKLNLMSLSSRNFAAQVFTVLKPAIDAAIDGFSKLTRSITIDDIRDAVNRIANYLIDLAASVARFMVEAGVQVDIFKGKLASLASFKISLPAGDDEDIRGILTWMAKLTGNYDRVKETLSKPLPAITFGGAGAEDPAARLPDQFKAIEDAAKRAHDAVNNFIPVSGTWQAVGQDMTRLNGEVLTAADSFTKLNAAAADNGGKNRLSARAIEIEEEIAAERSKLERIKQIFNQEASSWRITTNQKAVYTETAIEQAYQAELALIAQKEKLYQGDITKYAEVEREKARLTEQYQRDMLKTVELSQKEMQRTTEQYLQAFTGAFTSQLRGLLAGTESWAQAAKNIGVDLFMKLIQLGEQWVVTHAAQLIADAATAKTQAAANVLASSTADAAAATSKVTIDAGVAYAGVFANMAPLLGPAAAGPAGEAYAQVLAVGLPKLDVGAWEIPSVMPALLHPGEMIVPAGPAQAFRSAVSGAGGGQGGGGGTQIVFAPNVSSFNPSGMQATLRSMMPQLAQMLRQYQNLNPSTV
jgi:hypothetical protein